MKKHYFFAFICLFSQSIQAQVQTYWMNNATHIYSANSGNVGIGTSNPAEKLTIMGNLKLESNNLGYADIAVAFCNGCYSPWAKAGDLVIRKVAVVATISPDLILSIPSSGTPKGRAVKIGDDDEAILVVRDDGKVTIGNVPTPGDYRLYVEKGIIAELVKVAAKGQWPDNVFDYNYAKMPLSQVETYIKAEKHLPNVPSEAEVKKDGIDVAKMDATLLRHIEEIYLHLIDLKKENEALKKEIIALKKQ
jgi:trimeric autotransporter adhesin